MCKWLVSGSNWLSIVYQASNFVCCLLCNQFVIFLLLWLSVLQVVIALTKWLSWMSVNSPLNLDPTLTHYSNYKAFVQMCRDIIFTVKVMSKFRVEAWVYWQFATTILVTTVSRYPWLPVLGVIPWHWFACSDVSHSQDTNPYLN